MQNNADHIPEFYPLPLETSPQKFDVVGKAREFIDTLEINMNGEGIFNAMGTQPEKNFLLYGPPGTGKSMCVSAFNNSMNGRVFQKHKKLVQEACKNLKDENKKKEEITLDDFDVITFPYDIGHYGTAYINVGSRRVQAFFDKCFNFAAIGKKVLVVMDEFDAIGNSRRNSFNSGHSEDRKVLETIMKNLQKVHDTPNLYTILMTNEPEICDEAVLRAGRIDEKYFFDLPDDEERKEGFKKAISSINQKAGYRVIKGYNLDSLVDISEGFNYADIFQSVQNAVKQRARELYLEKQGLVNPGKITKSKLEKSVLEHKKKFKEKNKPKIGFKG